MFLIIIPHYRLATWLCHTQIAVQTGIGTTIIALFVTYQRCTEWMLTCLWRERSHARLHEHTTGRGKTNFNVNWNLMFYLFRSYSIACDREWNRFTCVCLSAVSQFHFLVDFYRATACNATHGIAVAILSVRLSVCPSDACIVTKLNNALRIFWYNTKRQSL